MSMLRDFNKKKILEKLMKIKWNINNVYKKFYKLIDFIYGRKLENHNIWDYKWKIKKLGQIHQLKIKNIINIKTKDIEKFRKLFKSIKKSKASKDLKLSFFYSNQINLPNIIKAKFNKFLNLLPYISNKKPEKFKLNFRNGWLKLQSKYYRNVIKIRLTNPFYFIKQDKLKNKLLIRSYINKQTIQNLVVKNKKYKRLSNIYNYIKPNVESLLIENKKISNFKKDLLIQKKIGLNYYEKNYNKIWKFYLRRWTAKHQMDNMTLSLISFYKMLNEFFTVFFLWYYRQKYWTEHFINKINHKRSSNSYRTKYQRRHWYSFLQENVDFIKFDSKLPLVKDTIKYIFIKDLSNKDLLYKYIFYKMFLSLINLNKIRNEWLFEPFKNLYLLIIINFFRKTLLIETSFSIYQDITTIFSKKTVNKTEFDLKTNEDDIDFIFSLINFRIYYRFLYNNNFESKTKIWSINMPQNRAETVFYIKDNIFSFVNWKFLYLFKLRQLISSIRFKQRTYNSSKFSGYRNSEVKISNWLRHKKFQVSGYKKFSISRAYENKNGFIYSNLIFYNISDKVLSDKTYLHNSQVFYNGYNTLKKKLLYKQK